MNTRDRCLATVIAVKSRDFDLSTGLIVIQCERPCPDRVATRKFFIRHLAVVPLDVTEDALRNDCEGVVREHLHRRVKRFRECDFEGFLIHGFERQGIGFVGLLAVLSGRFVFDAERIEYEIGSIGIVRGCETLPRVDEVLCGDVLSVVEFRVLQFEGIGRIVFGQLEVLCEAFFRSSLPVRIAHQHIVQLVVNVSAYGVSRCDWIKRCHAAAGQLQCLRRISLNILFRSLTAAATVVGVFFLFRGVVATIIAPGTAGKSDCRRYSAGSFQEGTPGPFVTVFHPYHLLKPSVYNIFVVIYMQQAGFSGYDSPNEFMQALASNAVPHPQVEHVI